MWLIDHSTTLSRDDLEVAPYLQLLRGHSESCTLCMAVSPYVSPQIVDSIEAVLKVALFSATESCRLRKLHPKPAFSCTFWVGFFLGGILGAYSRASRLMQLTAGARRYGTTQAIGMVAVTGCIGAPGDRSGVSLLLMR